MSFSVSCRVVSSALRRMEGRGLLVAPLIQDLGVDPRDPRRWLSWNALAALLLRMESALGGPAELTALGSELVPPAPGRVAGRALGLVVPPSALYRAHRRSVDASLGAVVATQLTEAHDGQLEYRLSIPADAVTSPQLFRLMAGMLRRLPARLAQPDALVDARIGARDATYRIVPPPSLTLAARSARAVRVLVSARATLAELAAQTATLDARLAELGRERDRAQAVALAKSQFLANMGHELRTPLNAILGTTSALLEVPRRAGEQHDLIAMQAAAERLLDLVNDALLVSGDDGVRHLSQGFDLLALVRVAVAVSGAEERGIAVRVTRHDSAPQHVRGDEGRLRRALAKILGNAVKFGREGGRIDVVIARDPGTSDGVAISVTDDGDGIPAEAIPHLFEPFTQADSSTTRAHDGAGLGLAVAHELVERMGGTIDVESHFGCGARFTVRLPLPAVEATEVRVSVPAKVPARGVIAAATPSPPPAVAPAATRTEDLPGASAIRRRVLVVEDNPVNQRLIVRIIEKLGCDVRVASDGQQALATLEREAFDAVLMDCQMPVMDGYDATRAIRAREALSPAGHLPVIAVTAHATDGDRQKCLDAGMDDYLTKPVRAEALRSTLVSWMDKRVA